MSVVPRPARKPHWLQVAGQMIQEDTGQNLACYRQKGYSSVVVAELAVSFALVDVNNCSVPN